MKSNKKKVLLPYVNTIYTRWNIGNSTASFLVSGILYYQFLATPEKLDKFHC